MPTKKVGDLPASELCGHPEHNPPGFQNLEPGHYEHTCPACGNVQKFTVSPVHHSINKTGDAMFKK